MKFRFFFTLYTNAFVTKEKKEYLTIIQFKKEPFIKYETNKNEIQCNKVELYFFAKCTGTNLCVHYKILKPYVGSVYTKKKGFYFLICTILNVFKPNTVM